MSGAPKAASAAEPEIDETTLAEEADEAAAPLDLDLDETRAEPGPIARGAAVIKSFWQHAPQGPGVYRMIGDDGEVLYVGKARSIKKRILRYTTPERQSTRIARMISQTVSMVFVTTESEAEALLLEANLIKQLKPRYNVTLRDDKSFPYILITGDHEAPQHRQASRRARARATISARSRARGPCIARSTRCSARSCSAPARTAIYDNRTRPCLLFRSNAARRPAPGEIALADYGELVREARDFLSGRSRRAQRLARDMTEASEALEFETAARLRDRISALSAIQGEQSVNPRSVPEADVFADRGRGRAFLHRGGLLPHLSELGQSRLFPASRQRAERGGSARRLSRAILSRSPGAAARAAEPRRAQPGDPMPRFLRSARGGGSRSARQARREEGAGRKRAA